MCLEITRLPQFNFFLKEENSEDNSQERPALIEHSDTEFPGIALKITPAAHRIFVRKALFTDHSGRATTHAEEPTRSKIHRVRGDY